MQGKKRYLVIALFLLLGLTTFTFANPKEELDSQKNAEGTSEKVASDKKENRSYAEALDAVEEAEENPTLETAETARTEIGNANDATVEQTQQLQNRVNVVENTIDVAALVTELETLVSVKETRDTASVKYPTAATEVNNLEEGNVKDNLVTRLERVEKILNDKIKPGYTGVENNQITNENVTLIVTDETSVAKTVTLNNEKVDFKDVFTEEGTYVVTLVDEAFLEETVTFTIDKTAPKFVDLKSGSHYETIKVEVDDTTATIVVKNMDTGETTIVTNGTVLTADATYYITVNDVAGNSKDIWVAIDTISPAILGVDEETPTNKNEIVYVSDKFLNSVTIDGKEYTRDDFTAENNNENFKFQKKVTKEGTHTVVAKDKYGNSTTKTFVIDKTTAKKNAVNANVNGYKNEVNSQYAVNGKTVSAYISVNEELKYNPTFTFYANGKEIKAVAKEDVVASKSTNATYPYVYTATLTIDENLVAEDGVITFTVTDIYDKAGNQTADITKMSRKDKVITLDRTAPVRKSADFYVSGLTQVEKTFYTQYGKTVVVNITTDEELAEVPTFTLHNNGNDYVMENAKYRGLNDKGYHLYQASFELTKASGMKDGQVTFTVSNIKDKAGNVRDNITEATNGRQVALDNKNPVVTGVNNKYFYKTPITIKAVDYIVHNVSPIVTATIDGEDYEMGTEYSKEGTHEFIAYDAAGNRLRVTFTIDYTAPTLSVKNESVGVDPYYNEVSFKLSDNVNVDYFVINGTKVDRTNAKWSDANYSNIKQYLVTGENTIVLYDTTGNSTEKTFTMAKNTLVMDNNVGTVNEDIYLVNEPFYNNDTATEEVVINGNGKTVTQFVTDEAKFNWRENYTIPLMGDVFSSLEGKKITVNDLTFKGTIQSISLGNFEKSNQGRFNTEFNNVNIIGTEVVSLSANISPGAVVYGKAVLNNTNIYGTKLSPLDTDPMWAVYDLAVVNYSNTTINKGKYGSIYTWQKANLEINNAEVDTIIDNIEYRSDYKNAELVIGNGTKVNKIIVKENAAVLTVKAGATIDTLDLSAYDESAMTLNIEPGATINKVITKDGEMTYAEWYTKITTKEKLATALVLGGNLILEKDFKLTAKETLVIAEGTSISLNLNGHTLTNPVVAGASIENNGTLTVTGNGSIVNGTNNKKTSHTIVNNGTLVIESGNIGTDDTAGAAVSNYGTVTINGGTFASKQENVKADGLCAYVFINNEGTMTINNATVNGQTHGLFAANGGELIVNGGEYTLDGNGGLGCYVAYSNGKGKVIINKGTITANDLRNKRFFYVSAGDKNYFNYDATNTGWIVADEPTIYFNGEKLLY